jgi:hypothetical protein
MNDERLEPIDEDLDALLAKERAAQPPEAVLDRIWARAASAPFVQESRPSRTNGWLASKTVPVVVAAFVLGAALGAGLNARLRAPPPERIVPVYLNAPSAPVALVPGAFESPAAPRVAPSAAHMAEPAAGAGAISAIAPTVPVARDSTLVETPHPNASLPTDSSSLSAEQLLLDQARAALTARDPDRALALLSEHAHRFSRPQLGEEREALAIQALAVLGRYDEARARAARFRASAPNSLFLPAVDATLASIP